MRIGIFGGSFDPPHVGHLMVALDALDELALDRLLIIPAAQQPLKGMHATDAEDRLAMARACFGGLPRIEVDPVEIDRGGLSFMVDTVETLRLRWPSASLFLLLGDDAGESLPRWHEVTRLWSLVQRVVLSRGDRLGAATTRRVATRRIDVSSTEIRARVRDGRSIRGFVSDAVETYIATTGLYLRNSRALSTAEDPARP